MSRDKHTEDFREGDACDALVLGYFAFGSTGLGPPTLFLKVIPLVEYKRPFKTEGVFEKTDCL